jgi:hypothetical protein
MLCFWSEKHVWTGGLSIPLRWVCALVGLVAVLCMAFVRSPSKKLTVHCCAGARPRLPLRRRRRCKVSGLTSTLWAMVWFFLSCRIGEARKPGPDWTLSVANLSGLNTRAFGFADSDYDVWLFSETHLTKVGIQVFWSNVRSVSPDYKAFQHGCPIAPRSEASDIGQWSGVGVMAKFPTRRLPHSWPACMYHSGRQVCTSFCAHGLWISGVVVYGTPTGPTHPKGRLSTVLNICLDQGTSLETSIMTGIVFTQSP